MEVGGVAIVGVTCGTVRVGDASRVGDVSSVGTGLVWVASGVGLAVVTPVGVSVASTVGVPVAGVKYKGEGLAEGVVCVGNGILLGRKVGVAVGMGIYGT